MNDYDVPEEKINVLRFGANQDVPDWLPERRRDGRLRLLFVGKEWKRKGGHIAVEALNSLRSRGIDAELTMVGCDAPKDVLNTPHVIIHPYAVDVASFFRDADVFILPTRAECAGIVFCEASAYGLPSFATATGGVPDYVEDGVNGRLLSLDAMGDDYADAIAELWNDQEGFKAMRLSARRRYEEELNWDVWMQHFERIAQKALTESKE
jgi:glycosyltransferase involved in cell wall biosynthesis